MAKTVTIPAGDNPFVCKINDVYYSYPAGTTVEVPDEVAALIQANAGNREKSNGLSDIAIPRDGEAGGVLTRTADGAEWATPTPELPAVSATDNGKVLKVVEGAWAAASGGVMVVNEDFGTGTLDKTWAEINDADFANIVGRSDDGVERLVVMNTYSADGTYIVQALLLDDELAVMIFTTDSEDGYPVLDAGD